MRKFIVNVNGNSYEVEVEEVGAGLASAPAPVAPAVAKTEAPKPAAAKPAAPAGGTPVKAPMPGNVLDIKVANGAQVKEGGQLSLMLKERVDMGIALYKAGITDRLIMSGDHGREDYDEVNAMKDYAIAAGVPSEHIFMDHAGFSTYDTMYRAREIFQVEDAVVVTQEYHLYRAVYNAKAMDMDVKGIFCDRDVYAGDKYRKLREALARVKDFGYCMIKPEPKYLGEAIPVSGNGDLTNDRE